MDERTSREQSRVTLLPVLERVPCALDRCGAIRVEPRQQQGTARALSAIWGLSTPDDTILDLSDNALLYFLSERRSPTRFHLRACWGPSPRLQTEAMGEILANPRLPACVVKVSRSVRSADMVDRWLESRYVIDEDIGELQFWRPR